MGLLEGLLVDGEVYRPDMSQLAVDYVANKSVAPLSVEEVVRVSHKCKIPALRPLSHSR